MEGFIKTWWHCLWRIHKGHRMCYYREAGSVKREYFCECSNRFKELTK